MAEKTAAKKRSSPRQQMLEGLAEAEKQVQERREAQASPEDKIEAKTARESVAVAEGLVGDGVVKSISELKSLVGRTLTQLSDRLEEEVAKYVQIQRAIIARDAELKEIYEIQRSASSLTALIEAQQKKRDELEADLLATREELSREIESTRTEWEAEEKQREELRKEQESSEQKRRQREKEEYQYAFAREQQQAKDKFADEMAKTRKELTEQKAAAEKSLGEREAALASREQELTGLKARAEAFPKDLEAAVARAAKEAAARAQQEASGREELLKRESAGEKNVLTTRITSLEQTVKEQAEQLLKLSQQAEKAYTQVQEIAVRAIEGSGSAKQLANLQQMLAEQARKGAGA